MPPFFFQLAKQSREAMFSMMVMTAMLLLMMGMLALSRRRK